MRHPLIGYLVLGGALLASVASCMQDFDELFDGPETVTITITGWGGTGGTVVTGGATTTTTPTTGTGGSMGGAGGWTGECTVPEDCTELVVPPCYDATCLNYLCGAEPSLAGTDCTEPPGANVCDGDGNCVECNEPLDCSTAGDLCVGGECIPPECTDTELNGNETDVDCGGPDCPDCADGLDCLAYSDCESQFCDTGICTACATDDDCADATGTWCDPAANDANGGCVPTEPLGTSCGGGNECTSGFCVDDVCCDVASCSNDCHTCAPSGSCTPVDLGDPCDDGTYCNGADSCNATGSCISGSTNPCPGADGDDDCSESCNESARNCTANDPGNSVCNDGLYCTVTDRCNTSGVCVGTGNPCPGPDGDDDCSESCNELGSNCTANDPDNAACDDGLYCTTSSSCSSGACVGSGDPCAANVGDCDSDCTESCNEGSDDCTANDPLNSPCDKNNNCGSGTYDGVCNAGTCI